jgi:F0F1-type ATP synthase epsilon subunit
MNQRINELSNRFMHLEILTPEKKIFEGDVTIATFPGEDG